MPEVGFVVPAHTSALGEALLAFQPYTRGRPAAPLRSMTGETIVDPARLAEHLTEIARTGIATEHDEAVLSESSLAAPIFDAPVPLSSPSRSCCSPRNGRHPHR